MSAFDKQVGGDHYTRFKIQLLEFAMSRGYTAEQYMLLKYYLRQKSDDDHPKMLHTCDMILDRPERHIAVEEFTTANGLNSDQIEVVDMIDAMSENKIWAHTIKYTVIRQDASSAPPLPDHLAALKQRQECPSGNCD
jgi:hypothetical protein